MDIKKSLSFLKQRIDAFECNYTTGGKSVIGLEALRFWLRNNYRTNPQKTESYVSKELTKLYGKLEENEDGHIFETDHFSFMKDADVFYTILQGLRITFEELMEPGKSNFRPSDSFELLHKDNDEIKTQLFELSNIVRLGFNKTERSVFEEKQREFSNLIGLMKFFSDYNKQIAKAELSEKNKLIKNQRMILAMSITNVSGKFITFDAIQNLIQQDIPLEYLQLQYFRAVQESKTSEMAKVFRELKEDQKIKYYDNLAEKIRKIIDEHPAASTNFLLYSCNVCLFDFINRMTIIFTNALSKNLEYQSALKLKNAKKKANDLLQFSMLSSEVSWNNFFLNTVEQNLIKNNFNFHEENITRFKDFLKKTNSKLRQLSVYLSKIQERDYSETVVNEIRALFDEYVSIIVTVIYQDFWNLTEDSETKIRTFLDKLDQHTIIIGHNMGEIENGVD